MKKAIALLLSAVMLVSLAACGSSKKTDSTPTPAATPSTSSTPSSTQKQDTSKNESSDKSSSTSTPAETADLTSIVAEIQAASDASIQAMNDKWAATEAAVGDDYKGNQDTLEEFFTFCEDEAKRFYDSISEKCIAGYKLIAENADFNDFDSWDKPLTDFFEDWDGISTQYTESWDTLLETVQEKFDSTVADTDIETWETLFNRSMDMWTNAYNVSLDFWETQYSDYLAVYGALISGSRDVEKAISAAEEEQAQEADTSGSDTSQNAASESSPAETTPVEKPAISSPISMDKIGDLISQGSSALGDKFSEALGGLSGLLSKTTYEDIYNDYSKQLSELGPKLLEEYKTEAAKAGSIEEKAEICTAKVETLAELTNEGVEKMAELYYTKLDYEEYNDWATKLYDQYLKQSEAITNEYMGSAY